MAPPKTSLGYTAVLRAMPNLEFDLEQLEPKIREKGTIDQIAVELEVQGSGNATSIRTAAMRELGGWINEQYQDARQAIQWIGTRDKDIAVWCACVCVMETLVPANEGFSYPRRVIDAAKEYLEGRARSNDLALLAAQGRAIALVYRPDSSGSIPIYYGPSIAGQYTMEAANYGDSPIVGATASYAVRGISLARGTEWKYEAERMVKVIANALPGMPVRAR